MYWDVSEELHFLSKLYSCQAYAYSCVCVHGSQMSGKVNYLSSYITVLRLSVDKNVT